MNSIIYFFNKRRVIKLATKSLLYAMWKVTRQSSKDDEGKMKKKRPNEEFFMTIGHTYTVGRKGYI